MTSLSLFRGARARCYRPTLGHHKTRWRALHHPDTAPWYPFERDASAVTLLQYLPDRVALAYARFASRGVDRGASWEALRRAGVRGGSRRKVMRLIGHFMGLNAW
jgi:hypothetical protein